MDSFPDIRAMTKSELESYRSSLYEDEAKLVGLDEPSVAYARRVLRGKLDLVDAEMKRR